ncbi:hypothetical protein [Burkholderia puraquae]|nr:hypothetical protein [Burkholderia puraquae]
MDGFNPYARETLSFANAYFRAMCLFTMQDARSIEMQVELLE